MPAENILVVDDAAVEQRFLRLLLTHEGYAVQTAGGAEEALRVLGEFRPSLVLTDMRLPGMDGLELARRIKGNPATNSIKVVVLSAQAAPGDEQRALGAGCDGYLTKPLDTRALASRVQQMLAGDGPGGVKPMNAPGPQAAGTTADAFLKSPETYSLRRAFLNEAAEHTRQFLDTLDSGFDADRAARLLHTWVGSGGLLGCSEVSKRARVSE